MKILVTGANGFIGKNLIIRLSEINSYQIIKYGREHSIDELVKSVQIADVIIHLAGVNRPLSNEEFISSNENLTKMLCNIIETCGRKVPLIISSSIQVNQNNLYGLSKRNAEQAAEKLANEFNNPVRIYRLPGVFGKWGKPNYNSVVATFCHNIANNIPIQITDPTVLLKLIYIDDLIDNIITIINDFPNGLTWGDVKPVREITLFDLANQINLFKNSRCDLITERVGSGLIRDLYATYVSYLPPSKFSYNIPQYSDERGVFVEMLKTHDSGQFSFFTAHPGVTRGGHYHHTKTEKFLVIKGKARFSYRHIVNDERYEIITTGERPQIVETIPGWAHDITNIADEEMIVMIWANEIFDRTRPDTIASKV